MDFFGALNRVISESRAGWIVIVLVAAVAMNAIAVVAYLLFSAFA